ncbi:MAG: hypothetical protein P8L16_00920, partial [Ilumatobacter sp.]|nr:hypothetical protein [Ilumatobacter sp.]
MPRVEHAVDRDVPLAHEILIGFHFGTNRDAVQLAVVVEPRVSRVHDVRHTLNFATRCCSVLVCAHRLI